MPRRLDSNTVKQMFIDAGYEPAEDFNYKNSKQKHRVYDHLNNKYVKISYQNLKYSISKGHRPTWSELPLPPPSTQASNTPSTPSPFERFVKNHSDALSVHHNTVQQIAFNTYKQIMPKLNRKTDFTYNFVPIGYEERASEMLGIVLSIKDSASKLLTKHNITIQLTTRSNKCRYININTTTISNLFEMFSSPDFDFDLKDSSDNQLLNDYDYESLTFYFTNKSTSRRTAPGFFPFLNTDTNQDLSRYGIYSDLYNDQRILEPCIITAFKSSNILNQQEFNQLVDMVKVRYFPQTELKHISEHFKLNIYVRNYRDGVQKESHVEFKDPSYTRSIKLCIYFNHYMLYEVVNKKSNYTIIKQMVNNNVLRPFTDSEFEHVISLITSNNAAPLSLPYDDFRPIHISDKHTLNYRKTQHTQHFFGYKPDENEIEYRLTELQEFINTLPLRHHINVRKYFKFSELMQKIMYEYGCFDDVYELSGNKQKAIRDTLTFPKRSIATNSINEKVYYIDFNGAFCSFMTHIPTGVPDNTFNFSGINTSIQNLIQTMYNKRLEAKSQGNDKFAKTLKFIMCSCYGASIKRPKLIKRRYSENIQATIREQGDLVMSYDDSTSGYISLLQPYVEHYSHPQFAKVILDSFNNKVNELKSIVNILFQNIDAFMVSESDFNKLNELGYIHPTELGKLKVEHVFQSVTFKNKNSWIGINLDGTEFRHCM